MAFLPVKIRSIAVDLMSPQRDVVLAHTEKGVPAQDSSANSKTILELANSTIFLYRWKQNADCYLLFIKTFLSYVNYL